jgi:hypothetical protein
MFYFFSLAELLIFLGQTVSIVLSVLILYRMARHHERSRK